MFRYFIYLWTPPILAPEQEIQIGRQIVLEGREAFLRKTPYLSEEEQQRIEWAKNVSPTKRIIFGVIFAALVIPFLASVWWLVIPVIPAIALSLGTRFHAKNRYRNWIDEMIAKYAAYAQQQEKRVNAPKTRTQS
jgi:hypothetical protein